MNIDAHQGYGLPIGGVLALSHSGSRGFGATIAGHYTQLAKQLADDGSREDQSIA